MKSKLIKLLDICMVIGLFTLPVYFASCADYANERSCDGGKRLFLATIADSELKYKRGEITESELINNSLIDYASAKLTCSRTSKEHQN